MQSGASPFPSTPLTRRLGVDHPIIAAPLGRGTTPDFLRAVADAGGIGFVALLSMPEDEVVSRLAPFTAATNGRFGVNLTLIVDQRRRLQAALGSGVRLVSLWYGDPAPYVPLIKAAGATSFWTVGSPEEAAHAADLGVDFLVVQGSEAGGHLVGTAPIMSLLPAVVDAARGVPVIAAGGIADGRGLAAALCLGACGIWMGTRFVASIEAANHPGHKESIVRAGARDLIETELFDGGWSNAPHRVIRNTTVRCWEEAGCPPAGARPGEAERVGSFPDGRPLLRYDVATPWAQMEGDWESAALYAGASAQLVRSVEPVRCIFSNIVADAAAALSQFAGGSPRSKEQKE
ncbi:MAG TPA: nitronate monooxygenase [Allosphingosinicella sp.]|uniref:NAD(P)H-dependent flavin oxidoreductase n=1 Tax=Allosphingosinicella sp. TaxID=2823234 RepID=UPI002EDB6E07